MNMTKIKKNANTTHENHDSAQERRINLDKYDAEEKAERQIKCNCVGISSQAIAEYREDGKDL